MKTTMRKAALTTAGLAVAGGLVFGATESFAVSPAAFSTSTAANFSPASVVVSTAASTSTSPKTTTSTTACKSAAHPARCAVRRRHGRDRAALLKRGGHGQATVKDKAGADVVREWQAGKVESISGSSVTVTDSTGTTWTWTVASSTKYRVAGKAGALSGVHVGDTILIRGQKSGSANDATRVFDPNQSKL